MKYPLNETILIDGSTEQNVFSWEVVRSDTERKLDGTTVRNVTRDELRITVPSEMKTKLLPGRTVSVDGGKTLWYVESNPHEVAGGWGWHPGLVIVTATKTKITE